MIIDNSNARPDFVWLQESDFQVIDRYRDLLDQEILALAHAFFDYLLSHPATAAIFRDFSSARLDTLVQKQAEHASGLLVSHMDKPWLESVRRIGTLHHHLGIEPSWIAGAYALYWRHWQKTLRTQVPESDRDLLWDALFRLLVGDLMAQLDGYTRGSRETDSERLALFEVLMDVLAAPHGSKRSQRPEDLLQQICDDLPAKSGSVLLAGYMVSDVTEETLTLEHQAGLLSPGLQIRKSAGDSCWKALESGQTVIQAVDDPQAPEWIKALRNQVEEIGIFPFGAEDLRGVGLIGACEKGYFQRVGPVYFLAFAHLGELVLLLRNQFLRDPLTALPNRVLFMDFLENARNQALRHERLLGVAILDLDGFKQVNDRLGHGAGDQLLQAVAQGLQAQLRAGDILARLGGDEFGLILSDLERLDDLGGVCERLLAALRAPLEIDGEAVSVTGSLGITLFPLDDSDADTLMRHADMALYAAKDAGRDQFHLHTLALDEAMQAGSMACIMLDLALQENRLVLHYQPIVSSAGAVIGMEALIRLQHPEKGLLSPAAFFPALDHIRLARPIGRFVLNAALHQAALWQEAGLPLRVSVNISARHLLDARFLEGLQEMLAKYPGLRPEQVEIEITESAPLQDMPEAQRLLAACHRLGVRVAIDDFGTGNASLTYLQRLPADSIKIDQSFVRDMIDDPKDLAIVTAIITASRMLGMDVIAEGVETADHAGLLGKMGCNHLQGYFFSKPIPAEDVPAWVAHFRPVPRTKNSLPPLSILPPILEGQTLRVQKFIGALRQENPFPAHVIEKGAEEYCHLGRWLRREGMQRFGATPQFARLLTRHERIHQIARAAKLHFDAGDADGAMEQGKLLDIENGLLLTELLAMAGESRDNIWS